RPAIGAVADDVRRVDCTVVSRWRPAFLGHRIADAVVIVHQRLPQRGLERLTAEGLLARIVLGDRPYLADGDREAVRNIGRLAVVGIGASGRIASTGVGSVGRRLIAAGVGDAGRRLGPGVLALAPAAAGGQQGTCQ